MKKTKWVVENKIELGIYNEKTNEWKHVSYEDASDETVKRSLEEDGTGVEISVLIEANDLGKRSYGWGGADKIILFGNDTQFDSKEDIEWAKKVAKTVAEALNKEGL